jgi:hypothetical protein
MKTLWTRDEIAIADELMSLAAKLKDEFLNYHKDFYTTFKGGKSYASSNPLAILNENEKEKWKVEGLRYALPEQNIVQNLFLDANISNNFPTATALTHKYIDHCGCSGYSILEGGGIIKAHVDIENRSHNTVRIHIPLIVPDGDIAFNVIGQQITWTDLFAFDNGFAHSAYNKTTERRLIYIIDITREFLGIQKLLKPT